MTPGTESFPSRNEGQIHFSNVVDTASSSTAPRCPGLLRSALDRSGNRSWIRWRPTPRRRALLRLAGAARANAQVIVTSHTKDFPEPHDVLAVHPDDFPLDQLDLYPGPTLGVPEKQGASHRREPTTVPAVLALQERSG